MIFAVFDLSTLTLLVNLFLTLTNIVTDQWWHSERKFTKKR